MWSFIKKLFKKKKKEKLANNLFWIGEYCFKYYEETIDESNSVFKLVANNEDKKYIVKKIDNRFYLIIDKECIINIPINKIGITDL